MIRLSWCPPVARFVSIGLVAFSVLGSGCEADTTNNDPGTYNCPASAPRHCSDEGCCPYEYSFAGCGACYKTSDDAANDGCKNIAYCM